MLALRIIPCLDVDNGRVVKGIRFTDIKDAGDPVEMARSYDEQGADEITFLDIGASPQSREILIEVVRKVSQEVFVPLTVGGGIRTVDDMRRILNAGADKIALCTSAVKNPGLLEQGSRIFGSQCLVLSVDAKRTGSTWHAYINGGRIDSGLDVLVWIKEAERLGAGEILLNSIDRDGTQIGYDLELTRQVAQAVNIPVIASGGAGSLEQILAAVKDGLADAVLLASLLHYRDYQIKDIKQYLSAKGVMIRW